MQWHVVMQLCCFQDLLFETNYSQDRWPPDGCRSGVGQKSNPLVCLVQNFLKISPTNVQSLVQFDNCLTSLGSPLIPLDPPLLLSVEQKLLYLEKRFIIRKQKIYFIIPKEFSFPVVKQMGPKMTRFVKIKPWAAVELS